MVKIDLGIKFFTKKGIVLQDLVIPNNKFRTFNDSVNTDSYGKKEIILYDNNDEGVLIPGGTPLIKIIASATY